MTTRKTHTAEFKRQAIELAVPEEARKAIFEYVEVYYNRKRRHSSLGYLTPLEAECKTTAAYP